MILIVGPDEGTTTPPGGGIVYTPGVIKWGWPVEDLGDGVIHIVGSFDLAVVTGPSGRWGGAGVLLITET